MDTTAKIKFVKLYAKLLGLREQTGTCLASERTKINALRKKLRATELAMYKLSGGVPTASDLDNVLN